MKKLLIIMLLLVSAEARAQLSHAQLWCQLGGQKVSLSGQKSSNEVQRSIPSCHVEIFNAGTLNDAIVFADNLSTPTPKANPFAALSNGTIDFWAAPACYDIVTSGGVGSDTFPAPYTYTAVCLGSGGGGGGGGGSGSVTSVGLSSPAGFQIFGSPVTGIGTLGFSMPIGWTSQDLLIGSGTNAVSRLPKGADNTCLTLSGGLLNWGASPCTGIPAGTTNQITKYTNGPSSIVGNSSLFDDGVNPVQSLNGLSVMTSGLNRILTNATPATTVLNQLVERNSSGFAINANTSSIKALGIAGQGAGVDGGGVQVTSGGYGQCVFDNQSIINDFVTPSSTTAGLCHDAGATRPLNAEVIGTVTTINTGVATAATVDFFTGDTSQTTPSAVNPCGASPGPVAYYSLASVLSCDTGFQTDGSGNISAISSTFSGASAGFLFFSQSSQPTFGVANSAYLFAPTSIPTTYALKLPSALGTSGQALTISGVSSNVATLAWSSAAGCPEGTCIQNAPLSDQTIVGAHALILSNTGSNFTDRGTAFVGIPYSSLSAFAQGNIFADLTSFNTNLTAIANGTTNIGTLQIVSDLQNSLSSTAFYVEANAEASGDNAALAGTSGNTSNAYLQLNNHSLSNYFLTGLQGGNNSVVGPGTVHVVTGVLAGGHQASGSPTIDISTAFYGYATKTLGTINSLFYGEDQGSGAGDYGIYLAGATHNLLGTGLTKMGSAQLTGTTGSVQCLHVDTTGLVSGAGGDCATGGSGTVTSIATTSPITGGTITTTGTIACATCVVASSPGLGLAHFAGSTQTVTSSLVVNADITAATIDLTTKVTGILPSANGGTANAFFTVAGPASSAKTFTFPNASATVLTSNAAVTVAQGGTGLTSGTSGGILGFTGSTTLASSVALTANVLVKGGGAGATPTNSLLTDNGTTATYTGTGGYKSPVYQTATNCAASGTAANPSVVSCSAAAAGAVYCDVAASAGTCTVNTSAINAGSAVIITPNTADGTLLSKTCNTSPSAMPAILLAAKVASTSFTINMPTGATNGFCFEYMVVN